MFRRFSLFDHKLPLISCVYRVFTSAGLLTSVEGTLLDVNYSPVNNKEILDAIHSQFAHW